MPINSFDNYEMNWKPDLKNIGQPLYKTLAEILEKDIKSGILTPGTKLPPQRELADYLDINLSTVVRAFKICSQKGLISASIGNGTYVSSDATFNAILLTNHDDAGIIEMGATLPDIDPNKKVIKCMQKILQEPDSIKMFQYGMPEGAEWQKEAAVKWIKQAGFDVKKESVLLAGGGQNAIAAILASLFKPGDKVGTDPVTYPGIKSAAKMLGIRLVPIQSKDNEITEEGLIYACKNENIKGLYLIPDFHNPTSHTMEIGTRERIAQIAKKHGILIMEDAIYSLLHNIPIPPIASFAPENTIYICSLSKTISPGLRLAYVITPQKYKIELSAALYNMNISVSALMAETASRLINSKVAEDITEERKIHIRKQNEIVDHYLSNFTTCEENTCMFRWLTLPKAWSGESFELYARNAGVQVYSAEHFAVGSMQVPKAVRISVTSSKDITELEKGVQILHKLLNNKEDIRFFL